MIETYKVICGDSREVLKEFSDASVDSVVTDPPYELGFMGKKWDKSGIAYNTGLWGEVLRVLKPGGHLLAFGGSRTYHRMACAIEDAGFEIRDQIQWIYGSGFPKSLDVSKAMDAAAGVEREVVGDKLDRPGYHLHGHNGGHAFGAGLSSSTPQSRLASAQITSPVTDTAKQWDGWGTALKPAHEPIVLARKPLIGTVAENFLTHGTGGLNVDRCRVGTIADKPGGKIRGIRHFNGSETPTADLDAPEPHPRGRFPANIIHDGSDEVLSEFAKAGELKSGVPGTRRKAHETTSMAGRLGTTGEQEIGYADKGTAARFFYCAKASKRDRTEGLENFPERTSAECLDRKEGSAGLKHARAGANHGGSKNYHPTVKPTSLMRYLCRLVTPPGGLVLDPFAGSGSTGKAAMLEGFRFVGIDLDQDFCTIAEARIEAARKEGPSLGPDTSEVKREIRGDGSNSLRVETPKLYGDQLSWICPPIQTPIHNHIRGA